jgi:hypothetical protein
MGGMGGTYDLSGGASTDLSGFNGSRAAVSNVDQAAAGQSAYDAMQSWLSAQTPPTTPVADAASPVVTNPVAAPASAGGVGFAHADYPSAVAGDIPHIAGAAPVVAPPVDTTPKEFAAPTSFANPWDAMIGANAKVAGKGLFYSDQHWDQNPEAVRQWLQAFADAGGDYRKQDKYYNTVSPGAEKIYWPGDPARPK